MNSKPGKKSCMRKEWKWPTLSPTTPRPDESPEEKAAWPKFPPIAAEICKALTAISPLTPQQSIERALGHMQECKIEMLQFMANAQEAVDAMIRKEKEQRDKDRQKADELRLLLHRHDLETKELRERHVRELRPHFQDYHNT